MSTPQLQTVVRHLQHLARSENVVGLGDDELLRRFVSRRDEAAFEVLVWRHGGMVLGLCRRLLGRQQDAEDAFQATFLAFVHEAASIARRQAVGGWLYRVAYRIALKLRARRRRQAGQAPLPDDVPAAESESDAHWRDVRPVLDEEINGLPEKYRTPFVLCYLQGKTNVEAAAELGWPQGTLVTRLAWARARLRHRLTRRGLALSTAALATQLANEAASAALPPALAQATAAAAVRFGAGSPAAALVSPQAAALTQGALNSLSLARFKIGAVFVLVLALLVGGAGLAFQPGAPVPEQPAQGAPKGKEGIAAGRERLLGKVVDAEGKPVADATVWATGGPYEEDPRVLGRAVTDAQGRFVVTVPTAKAPAGERLRALVARDARGRLGWRQWHRRKERVEEDIRLHEVGEVRGRILDDAAVPVGGARITPQHVYAVSMRTGRSEPLDLPAELMKEYTTKAAADGSFVLRGLPAKGSVIAVVAAAGFGDPRVSWECARPVTIRLERAATVRGSVTCPADPKAAAGVPLRLWRKRDPVGEREFWIAYVRSDVRTAKDGTVAFTGVPPGTYTLSVQFDPGTAFNNPDPPAPFEVKPAATVTVPAIALRPSLRVRGRVVDRATGAGIQGVEVEVGHLSPQNHLTDLATATTDAQGRYTAYTKPGRVLVRIRRAPDTYAPPASQEGSPRPEGVKELDYPNILLDRAVPVTGVVVDEAGRPVAGAEVQTVVPREWGDLPPSAVTDAEGKFTLKGLDPTDTVPLRVRTRRAVTDGAVVIVPAEQKKPLRLVASEKNAFRLKGTVVDMDGRPIQGARVSLEWHRSYVSKRSRLTGVGGAFEDYATDAAGRFVTGPLWPGDRYRVEVTAVGYAKDGSAEIRGRTGETHELPRLALRRTGGVVQGRVVDAAGRPVAGVRVFNSGEARQQVTSRTDAEGRFRLEDLYAGPVFVVAEKAGYRFTAVRVTADGREATVKLLKTGEGAPRPAPAPFAPSPSAEERKIARKLLERLWALSGEGKDGARRILESLARLDPREAMRWSARAGKRDLRAVRVQAAEQVAARDADEALALLAAVEASYAVNRLHGLAGRFLASDPARALRFAEELVVRSRTLEQPHRTFWLARSGGLVGRLGKKEAGRKLIDEAANVAGQMSAEPAQAFTRGVVAENLAPYDLPRALALLKPILNRGDRERYLGNVAVALAPHDAAKALALVKGLGSEDQIKMRLAHAVAAKDAPAAVRVAESIPDAKYRAEGFGWIAVAVAPRDRKLAHTLIDRALDVCLHESEGFRSWSNFGGRSVFAARLACQAREVGYPDMESVVARVLACRPTERDDSSARVTESLVATALQLAVVDPPTARQILEDVEPRKHLIGTGYSSIRRREWLRAWALADPARVTELFEKELAAVKGARDPGTVPDVLFDLAEILTIPPQQRGRHIGRYSGPFWFPGEE